MSRMGGSLPWRWKPRYPGTPRDCKVWMHALLNGSLGHFRLWFARSDPSKGANSWWKLTPWIEFPKGVRISHKSNGSVGWKYAFRLTICCHISAECWWQGIEEHTWSRNCWALRSGNKFTPERSCQLNMNNSLSADTTTNEPFKSILDARFSAGMRMDWMRLVHGMVRQRCLGSNCNTCTSM